VDLSQSHALPYIAGFFDGEGSIGIYLNGKKYGRTLRVQLTQTVTPQSTDLMTALRDRWGGSLCPYNKTLRRPAWNWQVSVASGYAFLLDVRPYLLLKADQADVALTWWASRALPRRGPDGRRMPMLPETRAADEAAELALKELKAAS
jgi:hypothetical protein